MTGSLQAAPSPWLPLSLGFCWAISAPSTLGGDGNDNTHPCWAPGATASSVCPLIPPTHSRETSSCPRGGLGQWGDSSYLKSPLCSRPGVRAPAWGPRAPLSPYRTLLPDSPALTRLDSSLPPHRPPRKSRGPYTCVKALRPGRRQNTRGTAQRAACLERDRSENKEEKTRWERPE